MNVAPYYGLVVEAARIDRVNLRPSETLFKSGSGSAALSITRISTRSRVDSSFRPSCSCSAIINDGGGVVVPDCSALGGVGGATRPGPVAWENGFMSANAAPLRAGDLVPHFSVLDASGRRVSYRDAAWQRRELVLIALPPGADPAESPARRLAEWGRQAPEEVAVIVTGDTVPGMPSCGFLVADRWGEIAVVQQSDSPGALPTPEQIREWVSYVQRQCPECQGETR